MKSLAGGLLTIILLIGTSPLYAGRCGLFEMFEGNDYCVVCPDRAPQKVYACPGGEVGMIAVGVGRPGCSVSYYSQATCYNAVAPLIDTMSSNESRVAENAEHNAVTLGRPALTVEGDEVIIRMKKEDFELLTTPR